MARKLTLEQKKKAVQIAIEGGSQQEYLKQCGCDAPDQTWWYIKNKLKDSNPDLYARIPGGRVRNENGKPKKAETKPVPEKKNELEGFEVVDVEQKGSMDACVEEKPHIKVMTVCVGRFIIDNTGAGLLIRGDDNQILNIKYDEIKTLVHALPTALGMFRA